MNILDFKKLSLREINKTLQDSDNDSSFSIKNPKGSHALAVGINKKININIHICQSVPRVFALIGVMVAHLSKKIQTSPVKLTGLFGDCLAMFLTVVGAFEIVQLNFTR